MPVVSFLMVVDASSGCQSEVDRETRFLRPKRRSAAANAAARSWRDPECVDKGSGVKRVLLADKRIQNFIWLSLSRNH